MYVFKEELVLHYEDFLQTLVIGIVPLFKM